ncbi:copper homeostasis protein CutC [Clostridium sp. OS1-26]|uniref:copper homeostasis protein CutC n=1 Tax=Clostridium sp. OS1-26 TaxID=3070681 RepID=UPI0027E18929|nr:copper homeostasis protein CutC [Clostridium sp. OS1-26]WML36113.1 copper homeostasis protein CutC [Clostridium sp. OS1-26]
MSVYEACVGSYEKALVAESLGANRIELCGNLLEGGTTPSYGTIKKTLEKLNIPVMVMIRPRGGDYAYSTDEIEIMRDDISLCKKLGAFGIVIGAVKDGKVDNVVIKELVSAAKPMSITFHMAFDEIEYKYSAIDELRGLGVDRILTKGGKESALHGKEELKKLIEYSKEKIIIMPGKGITRENRDYIMKYTGAVEVHGSKIV